MTQLFDEVQALLAERDELKHDIARHVAICTKYLAEIEQLRQERDILRKAIQDYLAGNYTSAEKGRQCKHRVFSWEACESCIDEHFTTALAKVDGK